MFTLAISCLTTSNLPGFMDLTFQVPMQYCSLEHGPCITSHIHNWALFSLLLGLFILSGVISLLFSNRILGSYWPGEFIFQINIFFPFHTVYGVLKARILKLFAIPFSRGPCFVRTLHHDPSVLGWPYTAWLIVLLSWRRLWSMWSVWLVFCDYGFHCGCLRSDG